MSRLMVIKDLLYSDDFQLCFLLLFLFLKALKKINAFHFFSNSANLCTSKVKVVIFIVLELQPWTFPW